MGCEIELKAHVKDDMVTELFERLKNFENSKYLGEIRKEDIYWSVSEDGEPLFRTRLEESNEGKRVLFTQKPLKKKDYCTEYNVENEFFCPSSEWDKIQVFLKGINLVVCRLKFKRGYHFEVCLDGFNMHSELLNVAFLGWFIETEICGENIEDMDKEGAEKALYHLLEILEIEKEAVEPKGYNKMLRAAGHERG